MLIRLTALILLTAQIAQAQVWPDYHGPHQNGHSDARGLPTAWAEEKNVKWKVPVPGRGWSSPVVMGNQVWLTSATPDGRRMSVYCYAFDTGKNLLTHELFVPAQVEGINDFNSYASPSPVLENGRAYVHFGRYGTACYDTKSLKTIWVRTDLQCKHSVGPGSSPILYKDLLILTFDGIDVQFVTALNKHTGANVWRTDRTGLDHMKTAPGTPNPNAENLKSFSTPIVTNVNGQPQLISLGAQCVYAYDPANGKELWKVRYNGYSNAVRPLVWKDMLFISTGYNKADLIAIRLGGTGDVTSSNVVWKATKNVPFKPSYMLVDDLLYIVDDSGVLSCVQPATGEQVYKVRLEGNYSASPLFADGKIYYFSEQGKTTVIKPGRNYEVLAENHLTDGFMASPAPVGKSLILRTKTALYRIEGN